MLPAYQPEYQQNKNSTFLKQGFSDFIYTIKKLVYINKIKDCLYQYAPKSFLDQSNNGILYFKGHKLLLDYLVDLFNSFYSKYLKVSGSQTKLNLNSLIMKKKYVNYKPYIDYLIQHKYIHKSKNHIAGYRSTEFLLNRNQIQSAEIIEYKNYDRSKNKRLLKF